MSLIEGIGDEVTLVFAVLVILVVGLLAWFSTHTSDIPFFSVIVVELSRQRARNRNTNIGAPEVDPTQTQSTDNIVEDRSPDSPVESHRSFSDVVSSALDNVNEALGLDHGVIEDEEDSDSDGDDSEEEETEIEETESGSRTSQANETPGNTNVTEADTTNNELDPVTETELRQRRVAFFESTSSKPLESSAVKVGENIERQETRESNASSEEHASSSTASHPNSAQSTGPAPSQSTAPAPSQSTAPTTDQSESISPTENQIRVRLKYLNDTQRLVLARPLDTIGYFKRTHFPEELAQQKLVRLIYNGQDLRNEMSTLQSCNVVDNSVLHCLVTQNVQTQPTMHPEHDDDINIGNFMVPIFGLLLGALWYLRFYYKQYFNATSTLSLAGISFLFVFAAFTSFRPHNPQRENQHLD